MPSVPREPHAEQDGDLPDDDERWAELEAALSVARAALSDALTLHSCVSPPDQDRPRGTLNLGQAISIMLDMLDAYLDDPPEAES